VTTAASAQNPRQWDRRPGAAAGNLPRLFIAAPIPEVVAGRVGELVDRVAAEMGPDGHRVRWVQMDGLHLTLRFLGPTMPDHVAIVAGAMDRAARTVAGPFEVRLGGAGGFPDVTHPRALWLGIRDGASQLGLLSTALTEALVSAGWELDARPFRPHLTIARSDGVHAGAEAAQRLIAAAAELDLSFEVDRVVLYRSHLGHGPARYEILHAASFG
jgi:2'-5' RNA ligase